MSNRNILIILILVLVLSTVGYALFFKGGFDAELAEVEMQLKETRDKFNKASKAQRDLERITSLKEQRIEELEKVKERVINRNQFSQIPQLFKELTRKHNLKLVDFTPMFDLYQADTSTAAIKAMPFTITVEGKYLNIGTFLEDWPTFKYYLVSDGILAHKNRRDKTDKLAVDIVGRLYAWNNGQR